MKGDLQLLTVDIRQDLNRLYVNFRNPFQPHGLPDPALGGIVHAAGLKLLLAAGVPARVAHIPDPDFQRVFSAAN